MKEFNTIVKSNCQTAVALGFFDGLHLGHQAVINHAVRAKKENLKSTVFTFSENPSRIISGKKIPYLIQPEEKNKALNRLGVDLFYNIDFSQIMNLTAEEFVKGVLVEKLNAKRVFCGFNYHFGKGRNSNADSLRELCLPFGIEVTTISPVMFKDEPISSTRIRHALKQARINDVTKMLGRTFSFCLPVQKGNQLGRQMGTPTFNQPFPEEFIMPKYGVYASAVDIGGKLAFGVTNIGVKPTIGSDGPLAETWMPGEHCGELYGKKIRVYLLDFIRCEQKFNSVVELKAAILNDGETAGKIFTEKTSVDN